MSLGLRSSLIALLIANFLAGCSSSLVRPETGATRAPASDEAACVAGLFTQRDPNHPLDKIWDRLAELGVFDRSQALTESQIQGLHEIAFELDYSDGVHQGKQIENAEVAKGRYRTRDLYGMGSPGERVAAEMTDFVSWLAKAESEAPRDKIEEFCAEAYIRLIGIHPFGDVNGRTSRLFLNVMLVRNGRPAFKLSAIPRKIYSAGYVGMLPWDAEYLAYFIRAAQAGLPIVEASRFGDRDSIRPVLRTHELLNLERIEAADFLNWMYTYISFAPATPETITLLLRKTPLTLEERSQLISIIKSGLMRTRSEETRREWQGLLELFGPSP